MDELLVDGYVKDIEKSLNGKVVPLEIIHLVSSYYCMLIRVLCCNCHCGIRIADINNRHPMKSISWKSKIVSLNEGARGCSISHHGLCYTTHIDIPSSIKQQISTSGVTKERIHNHKYDILFQYDRGYEAILFDRKQFETVPDTFTVTAFKWTLPKLSGFRHISSAFSRQFGLIAIGNTIEDGPRFQKLAFNSNTYKQQYHWKWNILNNIPSTSVMNCSCLTFDNQFVVVSNTDIAMYNLETNQWNDNLSQSLYLKDNCGLVYDNVSGMIYAGGGMSQRYHERLSANIEYYNVAKDKWFNDLPETWMSHAVYPVLWKDHSILYIASSYNDGAEYLDLRENAKMWTRVYINNLQSLSNVFGTESTDRKRQFRIIC
eukprot:42483_1